MKQYSATIKAHWTGKDEKLTEGIKELVSEGILKQTYPLKKEDLKDLEMYSGQKSLLQVAHKETEKGSKYKQVNLFLNGNSKHSKRLEELILGGRKN